MKLLIWNTKPEFWHYQSHSKNFMWSCFTLEEMLQWQKMFYL